MKQIRKIIYMVLLLDAVVVSLYILFILLDSLFPKV